MSKDQKEELRVKLMLNLVRRDFTTSVSSTYARAIISMIPEEILINNTILKEELDDIAYGLLKLRDTL
jgi:hypothetical protein